MDSGSYSALDRLLHRAAFGGLELQKAVADVEDRLYAGPLGRVAMGAPVFICSLPRAGTTVLLEALVAVPGYASHTYRDMPFVLCPLLWDRISRPFRKEGVSRGRAHGDGMAVSFDSPEAFEEVVWRAFWPGKYRGPQIALWSAQDRDAEFEDFFRRHMRKMVLARAGATGRYVSKNNANIARLPLLARLFPAAPIIVPFRNPLDQAASLLNQHRRFATLHARDSFARYYMESIGHLEFGGAFKPIAFPGLPPRLPDTLDFWLGAWTAAFSHVLENADAVHLVDFDRLCAAPDSSLRRLGDCLGDVDLSAQARAFRAAPAHDVDSETRESALSQAALALHARLRARAINAAGG